MDKTEQASRFNKAKNTSRWILKVLLPRVGQYWFWLVLGSLFVLIYLVFRSDVAESRLNAYLKSNKPLLPVTELISVEASKDMEYVCILGSYEPYVGWTKEYNHKAVNYTYIETKNPELLTATKKVNDILKAHGFPSPLYWETQNILFLDKHDQVWRITLTTNIPIILAVREEEYWQSHGNRYPVSCAAFNNAAFTHFHFQPEKHDPVLGLVEINKQ